MLHDLRYGVRALLRSPGFALVAILSLGGGIGDGCARTVRPRSTFCASVTVEGGVDRAVCHGILRRRPQRHAARIESVSLGGGAAGSQPSSSRTRH